MNEEYKNSEEDLLLKYTEGSCINLSTNNVYPTEKKIGDLKIKVDDKGIKVKNTIEDITLFLEKTTTPEGNIYYIGEDDYSELPIEEFKEKVLEMYENIQKYKIESFLGKNKGPSQECSEGKIFLYKYPEKFTTDKIEIEEYKTGFINKIVSEYLKRKNLTETERNILEELKDFGENKVGIVMKDDKMTSKFYENLSDIIKKID